MAQFSLRRILIQDFGTKYQDLLTKLAPILNNALEQVSNAFANSLTIRENFLGFEMDLAVTAPVNPSSPLYFKNTTTNNIRVILCGNVLTANGSTAPTGYPFFTFENSGNQIKVTNITNLTNGSSYTIRIYCLS